MSDTNPEGSERYSVTQLGNLESNDQFWIQSADALIDGMNRKQKFIPIEFVYDDLGSELFDKMVDSKEYYLPHKERGNIAWTRSENCRDNERMRCV